MKSSKLEYLLPLIVLVISLITWKHIPSLQFIGEGYQYFAPWTYNLALIKSLPHDLFARLASNLLIPIFRQNTSSYLIFSLVVMIITDVLFYLLVRMATQRRLLALLSALIFSTSFVGKYDMFSNGGYQYFLQRGVLLPILLLSLIFLDQYLRKNRRVFYLVSINLYTLCLFLGFFATWFLPIMFFYPTFYYLITKKFEFKRFIYKLWIPLSYLVINFLVVQSSGFIPQNSLIQYLTNDFSWISGVLKQLAAITFILREQDTRGFWTLILYLLTLVLVIKDREKLRIMLTFFLSLLSILTLNFYLNAAAVSSMPDTSRYFYYPYVCVAIFWGMFLGKGLSTKNFLIKILFAGIILVIFITNQITLQQSIETHSWNHNANKEALRIISLWSEELKQYPSHVFVPTSLGPYGATFAYEFFSHPSGEFNEERVHPVDYDELVSKKVDPDRLYVLHLNPATLLVEDKTQESRDLLIQKYLWQSK